MFSYFVVGVICSLAPILITSSQECTQGFMDYELLSVKAAQIGDSTIDDAVNEIGSNEENRTYILTDDGFTCSGTITGFLLAVDIRIDNGRDEYPWVALFDKTGNSPMYSLVDGSKRDIILGPDDFSTSGLYNYTLSSPIQFTSAHFIGVHQPDTDNSIVTLYAQLFGTNDIASFLIHNNGQYRSTDGTISDSRLLLHPISAPDGSVNCLSNFISHEDLKVNARLVTTVNNVDDYEHEDVFFPDIKFTCDGLITHVIVGLKDNAGQTSNPPEIRIWRSSNGGNTYTQSGPTIPLYYSDAVSDISTDYLRWYNLSVPVSVKNGDVLGIYQYNENDAVVYYQQYSGPNNYDGLSGQSTGFNAYPIVSVLIGSTTRKLSFTYTTSIVWPSTVITLPVTTISNLSSSLQSSNNFLSPALPTNSESSFIGVTLLAGVIVTVIVIGVAIIVSVTVLIFVITKRRKTSPPHKNQQEIAMNSEVLHSGLSADSNRVVGLNDDNIYEAIQDQLAVYVSPITSHKTLTATGLPSSYEKPLSTIAIHKPQEYLTIYNSLDSALNYNTGISSTPQALKGTCTPILSETKSLQINHQNVEQMHVSDENVVQLQQSGECLPTLAQTEKVCTGVNHNSKVQDSNQYLEDWTSYKNEGFFKEEPIYWDPENSTEGVYEQLAQQRYREIPRHEIRLVSHLGSGQFGTVDKGIWDTPKGPVEVAVKTLSGSVTEEDEVTFLQEAAINGQFHHPNIVQLCGVVTVEQPTMIILEYITHGDLKSFLKKLGPSVQAIPDASLALLVFKFSHQVASGMAYLSRKKFIHRDLAARNILVDNGTVCKIADFGMSKNLYNEEYYTSHNRTVPVKWTAIEAIQYHKYTTQSDVWSFGAVLYEIWSVGRTPFEEFTNQECIRLIESGYRPPSPSGCPRAVYQIMINCWNPVPSDRPSFDSLQSLLSSYPQSLSSPSDHPLSNLGSVLLHDQSLYPQLQNKYK